MLTKKVNSKLIFQPMISVILPSFKMGNFIGQALYSISSQTYPHWEVVVVDDAGPKDGTRAAVQAFANKHRKHRILYKRHKKNRGVSVARNTGIALAHGEYVALLDPDDWWEKDHLQKTMEILREHPGTGVISGPITNFQMSTKRFEPWPFADWMTTLFPASLASNNFLQPSATVIRTEALKKVGGFDESKKLQHIEDYDLWIRLVEKGIKFGFREKITCIYRRHEKAASSDHKKMAQLHENLVKKHKPFFLSAQRALIQYLMHKTTDLQCLNQNPLVILNCKLFYTLRKIKKLLVGLS